MSHALLAVLEVHVESLPLEELRQGLLRVLHVVLLSVLHQMGVQFQLKIPNFKMKMKTNKPLYFQRKFHNSRDDLKF